MKENTISNINVTTLLCYTIVNLTAYKDNKNRYSSTSIVMH